jgi:hypothetical protein
MFVILLLCSCYYDCVLALDQRLVGNISGLLVWFHKSFGIWFFLPERVMRFLTCWTLLDLRSIRLFLVFGGFGVLVPFDFLMFQVC